ncbi:MAG: winged helix DNA-binding domain-containing protein [Longimicrobiales bacterium]
MTSNREIAALRLHNQRITNPQPGSAGETVAWLCAVQAQDYLGSTWSLGLRLQGATDSDIEQSFNTGAILRTHLLRPTWHFVTPADIGWLLLLTAPRVNAANAHMYRQLGLDERVFERSNGALRDALGGGRQHTRDELRDLLQAKGIDTSGTVRMTYIMMRAELDGVVCSGGRRGKQFTYALLSERAPRPVSLDRDQALSELAARYFRSRGPATVHDFAKWSGLTVADARKGLDSVKRELQQQDINDQSYWFPLAMVPAGNEPVAQLLSIYDEYVSSYKDRSAMGSAEHGARLQAMGNALQYIVVVDGQIVGTWSRSVKKGLFQVATNLFMKLTRSQSHALRAAADRYGQFLQLPVTLE